MITLQLLATGEYLEIADKEKISFEFANNFFSFKLEGSFSVPFKLPNNPHNRAILGNIGLLNRQGITAQDIEVGLIILGVLWTKALLNMSGGALGEFINAEINIDYVDFKNRIGSKKLRDLLGDTFALPETPFTFTDNYVYKSLDTIPSAPPEYEEGPLLTNDLEYRLWINGSLAIGFLVTYQNQNPSIETILQDLAEEVNAGSYSGYKGFVEGGKLIFCPPNNGNTDTLYINRTFIKRDNNIPVFEVTDNHDFVDGNEIAYDILPELEGVVYPTIYNREYWDNKNEAYIGYCNAIRRNTGNIFQHSRRETQFYPYPQKRYVVTPMLKFVTVLEYILAQADYTHTGIFKTDSEMRELTIYSTFEAIYANKMCVPDVTAEEFIQQVCEVFCLSLFIDFDRKDLLFLANTDILAGILPYEGYQEPNWNEKAWLDQEILSKKTNYKLQYPEAENLDNFSLPTFITQAQLTKEEIIETKASTLKIGEIDKLLLYDQNLAQYALVGQQAEDRRKGNSDSDIGIGSNNALPIKLLFWRGLIEDVPTATASGEEGNYSMEWTGAKGLYEIWWKDYINFLQFSKAGKFKVLLNLNDLRLLTKRPYTRIRYENGIYLIKSVRVTIENSSQPLRIPADVELVRIPL